MSNTDGILDQLCNLAESTSDEDVEILCYEAAEEIERLQAVVNKWCPGLPKEYEVRENK